MKTSFIISISLFFFPVLALSQFNWDSYQPTPYNSLFVYHRSLLEKDSTSDGNVDVRVNTIERKYRIRVQSGDSVRPIDEAIKQLCDVWLTRVIQRPDLKDLFLHEILVVADGKRHWLPIQEPVLKFYSNEVSKGQFLYIYATLVGSIDDELILSVNEFSTEL